MASLKEEGFECLWLTVLDSYEGRLLVLTASFALELLRGLEKLKDGRCKGSLMETSDMAEGEREIGGKSGLGVVTGFEAALAFLALSNAPGFALSSSPLSITDRMLAALRGDLGCKGDLGGARPRWFLGRADSLVRVLGCEEPIESILLVRLGKAGDTGASVLVA